MNDDITLIIKTFERQDTLARLLASIRETDFGGPVLVADDSNTPYRDSIMRDYGDLIDEYLCLPFNVGLSAGRNALLSRVETPYFVLNDDDFVYGPHTDLAWMRQQLARTDLELLGGVFYEPKTVDWAGLYKSTLTETARAVYDTTRTCLEIARGDRYRATQFRGSIHVSDDTVRLVHDHSAAHPFVRCDYTQNFFMADTDAVRSKVGGWADELKLQEHWEFFYRAKRGGLRVAHSDEVGVIHIRDRTALYNEYREQQLKYRRRGLQLHGFREIRLGDWVAASLSPRDPAEIAD